MLTASATTALRGHRLLPTYGMRAIGRTSAQVHSFDREKDAPPYKVRGLRHAQSITYATISNALSLVQTKMRYGGAFAKAAERRTRLQTGQHAVRFDRELLARVPVCSVTITKPSRSHLLMCLVLAER